MGDVGGDQDVACRGGIGVGKLTGGERKRLRWEEAVVGMRAVGALRCSLLDTDRVTISAKSGSSRVQLCEHNSDRGMHGAGWMTFGDPSRDRPLQSKHAYN